MSVKEKVAQRKMVRSPGEIIPIVLFSVIAQGDSHKKKTEKHPVYPYSLPLRSMQCSGFYNRIRGCELLSLSLCENVCVCVCVYFSAVGFYLLLLLFSLLSKQPADHLLLPNTTANLALTSLGSWSRAAGHSVLNPVLTEEFLSTSKQQTLLAATAGSRIFVYPLLLI